MRKYTFFIAEILRKGGNVRKRDFFRTASAFPHFSAMNFFVSSHFQNLILLKNSNYRKSRNQTVTMEDTGLPSETVAGFHSVPEITAVTFARNASSFGS